MHPLFVTSMTPRGSSNHGQPGNHLYSTKGSCTSDKQASRLPDGLWTSPEEENTVVSDLN